MAPDNTASERTPLLGDVSRVASPEDASNGANGKAPYPPPSTQQRGGFVALLQKALGADVEKRILFAGFLITLSFSFTQVP